MLKPYVNFFRLRTRIVLALFVVFAFMGGVGSAFAIPPEPPDDEPIGSDPFEPPTNGFVWSVPVRFGLDSNVDGLVDFHWIQNGKYDPNGYYDPTYVNPNQYPVTFDGCQTESESQAGESINTYRWRFLSPGEPEDGIGTVVEGDECRIVQAFPTQDTYRAQLTITKPGGTQVLQIQQEVVIKDYLIVSIGDSFASGEGNPDVRAEQFWWPIPFPGYWVITDDPQWQDARCARSKWSGPAQAAMAIERSDPHTSVTFLSFACSGATINTEFWEGNDINRPLGTGILGKYRGAELPPGSSYDRSTFIPSQIYQVLNATQGRSIDALIVSAGGNDIYFGTVAEKCASTGNCWINAYGQEYPDGPSYRLDQLVQRAFDSMPARYSALAYDIQPLNAANVYITQYPDLTRSDTPNAPNVLDRYCSLLNDILWPFEISPAEAKTASEFALDGLNQQVSAAAEAHDWIYVDGIADQFRVGPDGRGHGYCASDAWIRNATDSWFMQGPYWDPLHIYQAPIVGQKSFTRGSLHPTARGHQVYAQRLVEEIMPRLNPGASNTPPPTFSASLTSGTSTSREGQNGWLTGRCVGATCTSDRSVLQVDAAAQGTGAVLRATKVTINGVDGCNGTPGISCTTAPGAGNLTYSWSFNITQTGVYHLEFLAKDNYVQTATFAYEIKVDLDDPVGTMMVPAETPYQAGWYTAPVSVTLAGDDPTGFSGVASVQYNLDGTAAVVIPGSTLTVNTDGTHSLLYQATDMAGRQGSQQSFFFQIDQTAPATTAASGSYQSGSWTRNNVLVNLSATDGPIGSGVYALIYRASGAQPIGTTMVAGESVGLTFSTEGETTLTYFAQDEAGNVEVAQTFTIRIDRTNPTVSCSVADGVWHASDVSIACSASDSGSGFANGSSTAFSLTTNVASGTETPSATTGSQQVCDLAGNCATAGPVSGNMVDKKGPDITVTRPTGDYLLNESVLAAYSCSDSGSGLANCAGPVFSGSAVDTASPGSKSFSVQAVDNVGNVSTQASGYNVSYKLCILYDQTKAYKSGSNVPVKLQLCDANGVNVSAPGIVLHTLVLNKLDNTASSDVVNTGNSNPDYEFRYDAGLGGYIYNLSTGNLSAGTWALNFTVSGDPLIHTVMFDVR